MTGITATIYWPTWPWVDDQGGPAAGPQLCFDLELKPAIDFTGTVKPAIDYTITTGCIDDSD